MQKPIFLEIQDKLINGEGNLNLVGNLTPVHIIFGGNKNTLDTKYLENRVLSSFYFTYLNLTLGNEENALKNLKKDIELLDKNKYISKCDDFHNMIALSSNVIDMKINKNDRKLICMFNGILPYANVVYIRLYNKHFKE